MAQRFPALQNGERLLQFAGRTETGSRLTVFAGVIALGDDLLAGADIDNFVRVLHGLCPGAIRIVKHA